jgi:hypothetical protein
VTSRKRPRALDRALNDTVLRRPKDLSVDAAGLGRLVHGGFSMRFKDMVPGTLVWAPWGVSGWRSARVLYQVGSRVKIGWLDEPGSVARRRPRELRPFDVGKASNGRPPDRPQSRRYHDGRPFIRRPFSRRVSYES